ncbi:hypothetical protein, partial [Vibrio diabolicus]|uniref:hypothetical protein n=1 Tax=Vibrio diabolicus TaxID=50719 RepID=UPI002940BA7C
LRGGITRFEVSKLLCSELFWGTFELESATGKNSIREAFGQKLVRKFTLFRLLGIRKSMGVAPFPLRNAQYLPTERPCSSIDNL